MDITAAKITSAPWRIKDWFARLSFWKKIIIIFTLNTFVLLVLTDTIMLILFQKVADDVLTVSNTEKNQFNSISNTQIVGSVSKMLLSKFDLYANFLAQLINTYTFFNSNPSFFTSSETGSTTLPRMTSAFSTAAYNEPGVYYFSTNSSKADIPYIDELLSRIISQNSTGLSKIKRINIFIQNVNNPTDLTIRTLPATNDFIFNSLALLENKKKNLQEGYFTVSQKYSDVLSKKNTTLELFALRTKAIISQTYVLVEIQLLSTVIESSLNQIYYFPSTYVMFVKNNTTGNILMSQNAQPVFFDNLYQYYSTGTQTTLINGISYLSATISMNDQYKIGSSSLITNKSTDPFRCIVLVAASEAQQPSIQIQTFLGNQESTLQGIVIAWSFVILFSTMGLATVVGNYVFSNLKILSIKMKEYIKEPSKFHLIIIQLKQLQIKGILKKLTDNLIGIIQKIQVRKREKKDRINQNYHPLSIGEPKFQERQQLNDYEILEEIKEEIRIKTEALKKEAEEKEAKLAREKEMKQKLI